MTLSKKLAAVFAALMVCAAFIPVLAIADPADDQAANPQNDALGAQVGDGNGAGDGNEPARQDGNVGTVEFQGAVSVADNTLTYEDGFKLGVAYGDQGAWNGTNLQVPDNTKLTLTVTPPAGYSGTPKLFIDGNEVALEGGVCTYTTNFAQGNRVMIDLDTNEGPQHTRQVKVTVDEASVPMLTSDKCRFTVGYGDDNDVEFTQNGATLTVDDSTRQKIILAFSIQSKYFIPTAIVNGRTYETTDTGTSTDPTVTNICVELTGDEANVGEFTINLSIGAHATVALESQGLASVQADYMMVENGKALMTDTMADVALTVNDTQLDSSVDGAVATFDLGVTVGGQPVSTVESPLKMTMKLDTNKYTAGNYGVVRNHEGTRTELDSEYDATTGNLTYSSSDFSDYSLVEKGDSTTKASTAQTKLAATGDPLVATGMAVASLLAFGAVAFAMRRLREQA